MPQQNNQKDQTNFKKNLKREQRRMPLMHLFKNNFQTKDFQSELLQDQDNQEGLMDMFWKERNQNFMSKKLNRRRNDFIYTHNNLALNGN